MNECKLSECTSNEIIIKWSEGFLECLFGILLTVNTNSLILFNVLETVFY